jgi:hypothetical protein
MRSQQTAASLPAVSVRLNAQWKYPSRHPYVLKMRGDAKPDALADRLEGLDIGQHAQ